MTGVVQLKAVHPNRSDFKKRHPGSGRCGQQCRRSYCGRNPLPSDGHQKRIDGDEAHGTLKRRAGGTPERDDGLGPSAGSRRFRAATGFTLHIRPRAKHLVKQYEHGLIR